MPAIFLSLHKVTPAIATFTGLGRNIDSRNWAMVKGGSERLSDTCHTNSPGFHLCHQARYGYWHPFIRYLLVFYVWFRGNPHASSV